MTLMDTLEVLTALMGKGVTSIHYSACFVKCKSIREFLQLCDHFSIDVIGREYINLNIDQLEKEYSGWKVCA